MKAPSHLLATVKGTPRKGSEGSNNAAPPTTPAAACLSPATPAGQQQNPLYHRQRGGSGGAGGGFKFVNTICCNALLSAYANASPPQWKRGLLLLSAMQQNQGKIAADCVAYNTGEQPQGEATLSPPPVPSFKP